MQNQSPSFAPFSKALELIVQISMNRIDLKIKSALANAMLSVLCITALIFTVFEYLDKALVVLYILGFLTALLFGWLFSGWYKSIPNEKWLFEPYVASVVICFPSAISTGLLYMSLMAMDSGRIPLSEIISAGIIGGIFAAVFVLPITITIGAILGWYLKRV
jgi:hypothetical protein